MPSDNENELNESERLQEKSAEEIREEKERKRETARKQRIERLKQYSYTPGQTGNPNGRPKGTRTFANVLEELMQLEMPEKFQEVFKQAGIKVPEKLTYQHGILAAQMVKSVVNKDTPAAKLLIETKDGRPVTPIDANIDSNINVMFPDFLTEV